MWASEIVPASTDHSTAATVAMRSLSSVEIVKVQLPLAVGAGGTGGGKGARVVPLGAPVGVPGGAGASEVEGGCGVVGGGGGAPVGPDGSTGGCELPVGVEALPGGVTLGAGGLEAGGAGLVEPVGGAPELSDAPQAASSRQAVALSILGRRFK